MHFRFMTYMATPLHKNPAPGVMKFTIFVHPSFQNFMDTAKTIKMTRVCIQVTINDENENCVKTTVANQ